MSAIAGVNNNRFQFTARYGFSLCGLGISFSLRGNSFAIAIDLWSYLPQTSYDGKAIVS